MSRKCTKVNGPGLLDRLESRQLMSQVNVTSFGAVPNDGRDDLAAVKAAMNASANGDTIYFPSGTYNFSDEIFLKGSRTYAGADPNNTIIQSMNLGKHTFHVQQDNTTIKNFTIQGKPIMIDTGSGAMVAGLTINNNIIRNTGTGNMNNVITFTTGLRNSSITNNKFDGVGPMGIYGYYWDGLTIANNDFLNGGQGIHVDDHANTSKNLTIEQNLFSGLHRMGVEYQGGGTNLVLQDNWYEKPSMTSNFNDNNATFAFSIVADRSKGTIARRNVIWAPERPDGVGVRIGFETGGDGTLVENNYVYGINQVLANTDGAGTTSVLAQNNYYFQVLQGLVGRGLTSINNGPQVNLQWLYNRGKAGFNRRFTDPSNPNGGVSTTNTTTSTPSTPSSTPTSTVTVPAPTSSGTTYLGDINWASATNGWGTAEKNKSNGESGAGDGHAITIGGKAYSKGLGVHANSEIVYNLNKQYTTFQSDIGVDDEVGNSGSVVFQVYLDNVKVFDSGKMTGSSANQSINLNVSGKTTMKLVVTDSGDGNSYDHGDWANAALIAGSSTTGSTTATPSNISTSASTKWLSDLAWSYQVNGWGTAEKDKSNGEAALGDGKTITLRNTTYAKGLGTNANSDIRYALGGKYTNFSSDIGIDNETNGNGSVVFRVYLDGKLAYDSGIVRGKDAIKQISLNVTNVQELRLVVDNSGDGNAYDHADWAGARVS
ncbi:MAG TPA: NPCBM/NEW2 domain-containing protein [Tepidisphaeraceae bacterium]|nr:NPCBM/NEW2 domain-containing protein [Tepidisphaeraceae bacterium]